MFRGTPTINRPLMLFMVSVAMGKSMWLLFFFFACVVMMTIMIKMMAMINREQR
jgi:hypothetical protein